jgi:hypothetical protein
MPSPIPTISPRPRPHSHPNQSTSDPTANLVRVENEPHCINNADEANEQAIVVLVVLVTVARALPITRINGVQHGGEAMPVAWWPLL